MTAFRLAARLARRETRRRPWRTVLVALLVAFPVAGMTMAAAFVRTEHIDDTGRWRMEWGEADLVSSKVEGGPPEGLPDGSRVEVWRTFYGLARTVDRHRAQLDVTDGAVPLQVMSGRAPTAAGEAFLTRDVARRLGVGVGDVLQLERPTRIDVRVTGTGERLAYWGASTMVLGPGTDFPWTGDDDVVSRHYLVDLPSGVTARALPRDDGVSDTFMFAPWVEGSRPVTSSSRPDAVAWSWLVGAVVLTVVGIVIAAAFAAGARRQLSTLGQLSANGAAPAVLRRVLFLQGTWTGVLGVVVGLGLGAVGLAVLAPHADRMFNRDVDPWTVRIIDLVPVAVLGVVAATVAAAVPARTTGRIPVLAALAGRRPLARVPRWVTVAGLVSCVGGVALLGLAALGGSSGGSRVESEVWALTAVVGGVAVLLGACGVAPGFTSLLEPLGGRLRGSWRLAARSLARQRTRTSAVVAAVCASAAVAVAASAVVLSIDAQDRNRVARLRPDEVHLVAFANAPGPDATPTAPVLTAPPAPVVARVQGVLPESESLPLTVAAPSSPTLDWTLDDFEPDQSAPTSEEGSSYYLPFGKFVAGAAVADAVAVRVYRLRAADRKVLERDGALLLHPTPGTGAVAVRPVDGPGVPLSPRLGVEGRRQPARATLPVTVVDSDAYPLGTLPRLLLSPAAVERLGFTTAPGPVVVRASGPITADQRSELEDVTDDVRLELAETAGIARAFDFHVDWLRPDTRLNPLLLEALLTGGALLFSLFVVATGLALAAAETRDERDVLTVVGASPAALRGTSGRKAALLAGLGAVLAVPVGFVPAAVLLVADRGDQPIVFPWRVVGLLILVIPVLAGLVTTGGSALALRLRPVRISTMAFD